MRYFLALVGSGGWCIVSVDPAVGVVAKFRWFGAIPAMPGGGDISSVGVRWMAVSISSPPCRSVVG